MKKNLWILLALAALIAMFVIAGCAPKPTSPTPTQLHHNCATSRHCSSESSQH